MLNLDCTQAGLSPFDGGPAGGCEATSVPAGGPRSAYGDSFRLRGVGCSLEDGSGPKAASNPGGSEGARAARPQRACVPPRRLPNRPAAGPGRRGSYLASGLATLTDRIWGNTYGRTCQDFPASGLTNSWPVVVPA